VATDRKLAADKYRSHAPTYDRRTALGERIRRRAIAHLHLQAGDTVLEVACGTGINFPVLEGAIGETGHLVGVDLSRDMLAKARERIAMHEWRNVTLIEAPAEEAEVPIQVDAMLFSFTHDVLQSPSALERVFRYMKPGARVAAASMKWAPWWTGPVNLYVWWQARRWITTFEGFGRPWRHLSRFVPNLRVESAFVGAVFIAWGTTQSGKAVPHERAV
jgi:ubiquinone/menaquinone biosynthesis C-methylase UbiE